MPDFHQLEATARRGSFSAFDMAFIHPELAKLGKNSVYLEVGVQYGRSLEFARKFSKGKVCGIDIDGSLYEEINDVFFYNLSSNEAVKAWDQPIDLLFIDADHSYEGCLDDWNNFSPFVKPGGWVFFHDCDATSPGVEQVFDEIGEGWSNKEKSDNPQCSMAKVQKNG